MFISRTRITQIRRNVLSLVFDSHGERIFPEEYWTGNFRNVYVLLVVETYRVDQVFFDIKTRERFDD